MTHECFRGIQYTCEKCGKGKTVAFHKSNQWIVRQRIKGRKIDGK